MTNLVNLATFENQVYLVERVKIYIDTEYRDLKIPAYKYKRPFPNKNYRLKDLVEKRLNKYLEHFNFHFYDTNINDYIHESYLIYDVRQKLIRNSNPDKGNCPYAIA